MEEWRRLVVSGEACLVGPIRQEILSGIRSEAAFISVQERLGFFQHAAIHHDDYDRAASLANTLRRVGIASSATDMLLCAVATRLDIAIFTTDADFRRYAGHIALRLHEPGNTERSARRGPRRR